MLVLVENEFTDVWMSCDSSEDIHTKGSTFNRERREDQGGREWEGQGQGGQEGQGGGRGVTKLDPSRIGGWQNLKSTP